MHVGLIAVFLILAVALIAGGLYLFASGLTARLFYPAPASSPLRRAGRGDRAAAKPRARASPA